MYLFSIVALRNYYKHISWRQISYLTVLRLAVQAQCDAARSWLWVFSKAELKMLAELLSFMESQGMEHSQVHSGWQNSVPHGYWIEVPTSLLALTWGLFSTSRGWLRSFAGGLLLPSSKLATVKSRRVKFFSCFESLWPHAPLLPLFISYSGYGGGHISSNNSDCMDSLPSSPYTSSHALQTCFWQSPKGHVTCVHELKADSSVFLFCFSGFMWWYWAHPIIRGTLSSLRSAN